MSLVVNNCSAVCYDGCCHTSWDEEYGHGPHDNYQGPMFEIKIDPPPWEFADQYYDGPALLCIEHGRIVEDWTFEEASC